MSDIKERQKVLVKQILGADGKTSLSERRAAFENRGVGEPVRGLVDKIAKHACRIVDEDIAAAKASGLAEDQIFEIVVCAAVGQGIRHYETALAALTLATEEE
jgi:hypothetical protein